MLEKVISKAKYKKLSKLNVKNAQKEKN